MFSETFESVMMEYSDENSDFVDVCVYQLYVYK